MPAGLIYAALSAVFNGSFGTLTKAPNVRAAVHPLVFNYWMAEGAAVAGVLALAAEPRVFTAWGMLSGALFVAATANTFVAIHHLGLSVASGIWCGVAVLTSLAFGMGYAGDQLSNKPLAGAALLLLVMGIAGIAAAGQLGQVRRQRQEPATHAGGGAGRGHLHDALLSGDEEEAEPTQQESESLAQFSVGCTAAISAGAFGGLVLAPMLAAPPHARGIPFIPSMSLGIFVAAPLATFCLSAVARAFDPLRSSDAAAWNGMASGAIWQAGNACSILAVQDPRVGLAVAYPIMQCGLFVAGAWGILLFRELRGRWQVLYWVSGAVLLTGAALLSASK